MPALVTGYRTFASRQAAHITAHGQASTNSVPPSAHESSPTQPRQPVTRTVQYTVKEEPYEIDDLSAFFARNGPDPQPVSDNAFGGGFVEDVQYGGGLMPEHHSPGVGYPSPLGSPQHRPLRRQSPTTTTTVPVVAAATAHMHPTSASPVVSKRAGPSGLEYHVSLPIPAPFRALVQRRTSEESPRSSFRPPSPFGPSFLVNHRPHRYPSSSSSESTDQLPHRDHHPHHAGQRPFTGQTVSASSAAASLSGNRKRFYVDAAAFPNERVVRRRLSWTGIEARVGRSPTSQGMSRLHATVSSGSRQRPVLRALSPGEIANRSAPADAGDDPSGTTNTAGSSAAAPPAMSTSVRRTVLRTLSVDEIAERSAPVDVDFDVESTADEGVGPIRSHAVDGSSRLPAPRPVLGPLSPGEIARRSSHIVSVGHIASVPAPSARRPVLQTLSAAEIAQRSAHVDVSFTVEVSDTPIPRSPSPGFAPHHIPAATVMSGWVYQSYTYRLDLAAVTAEQCYPRLADSV
ncbi:hypothetical protein EXIGLDRAFT_783084 [Exidia glandulosa HHB12029]|uniref:Uncharacterized protein n=1 Tax=Exidia glandulosa HHB12029 TaxID=1314781 RepID=A0A166N9T5_EXIGL|nr:hypothetical protein EXIGLDRAFT_783084 [Exidia glandulosa HHB12029]